MQKFVVVRNRRSEIRKLNGWFRFCEEKNIPFVYVERVGKFWKVGYDIIAITEKHEIRIDDIYPLRKEVSGLFRAYTLACVDYLRSRRSDRYLRSRLHVDVIEHFEVGRVSIHVGLSFGYFKGLQYSDAIGLANELYDILTKHLSRLTSNRELETPATNS